MLRKLIFWDIVFLISYFVFLARGGQGISFFAFSNFQFFFFSKHMCLAIPGKIKKINKNNSSATVDFDGLKKQINISLIKPKINDYVLVHAGFAIEIIDEKEAEEISKLIKNETMP